MPHLLPRRSAVRFTSIPFISSLGRFAPALLCGVLLIGVLLSWVIPSTHAAEPVRKATPADLPLIPHTEPADALKTFQLARGFSLELVAAEPLVADPVDACFDEFGRMYVAEMHGYPFSHEPTKLNPQGGGKKDAGIIRLLQDTNGDGRMDKSVVFADQISWPTSVCCYNGGVFVLAPQYLYYFKDTDGDNKADVREIVLSGFGRGNVQAVANGLKWGLDNRIYFAGGRNPADLKQRGRPLFSVSGRDVRLDPKTETFERVTGGQQFGLSLDDWGNRFVCSNSNHIQQIIFPQKYLARNPYLAVSGLIRSIAADGAGARVYRTSPPEPWRIMRQKWRAEAKGYKLVIGADGSWQFIPLDPTKKKGGVPTEYPIGYFTSATGVTIYRGSAYPEEFHGNAFIGDVGGNLVHRKVLTPSGVTFSAQRADENTEFIRSTDNWFRPVNFVNAPDGSLYVLDMYRETIEHPYSIPEEIKQYLHLQSGSDRGRIYRIVSPHMRRIRPPRLGDFSNAALVAELESGNSWNRETAQRLLWERDAKEVVPQLESLARKSAKPLARVHALHTLAGLGVLTPSLLEQAFQDSDAHVREHAVQLSAPFLKRNAKLVGALLVLSDDDHDRVRFQLAFALGEADGGRVLAGLTRLARDPRNNGDIRTALLSSVGSRADRLAAALLGDDAFLRQKHAAAMLSELALIAGSNPDPAPSLRLLSAAISTEIPLSVQQVVLASLGEGLQRRGASLSTLLQDKAASPPLHSRVGQLFARAARLAADEKLPLEQRAAAIGLLAFADFDVAAEHLPDYLSPQAPMSLQRAAVSALGQQKAPQAGALLLSQWKTYSPQLRRDVSGAMLASVNRTELLLAAIKTKAILLSDLEQEKKQRLRDHPNAKIRAAAKKLLGREVNSDRAAVVAAFRGVLELEGQGGRGLEVFKRKCAVCHRAGELGHRVAPDFVTVQNKSTADLLLAILDPNREAQPNFNVYNVITEDGRIQSGIIAAETTNSITLRQPEAKEVVVLRKNIEQLVSSGKSLMPEGLEKELSPQDLADVMVFIKSIKSASN